MIDSKQFKIRCSAIGDLMAGNIGLTETQAQKFMELTERERKGEKPLTDNMKKELADLTSKQKNPELPQTLQTLCLNWIKERLYQRRKDFSSKYTEKGIIMEQDAIELCSDLLGWGMVCKNTERFFSEHIEGEPDVILSESIEDIKCSWDCFSFPLFHTEPLPAYWWQMQGYMFLTDKKKAGINYCLMDAPESIIEMEARIFARNQGEEEVTVELFESVREKMTYSHLPLPLRHKRYEVEFKPEAIEAVKDRVELCRKYIDQVLTTINQAERAI